MPNETIEIIQFPELKAFGLQSNVWDSDIMNGIIRCHVDDVLALFLGPSPRDSNSVEEGYKGMVSAGRFFEFYPEFEDFNTKYYAAALAVWKPELTQVHLITTNNLRFCLNGVQGRGTEGATVINTLNELVPSSLIFFLEPGSIFTTYQKGPGMEGFCINASWLRGYLFDCIRWRGENGLPFDGAFSREY